MVGMAGLEDIAAQDDGGTVPAEGELGEFCFGAPQFAVVRGEEKVRLGVVADDPEVDPTFDRIGVRRVEEGGRGPGVRITDVGAGRAGGWERDFAVCIERLVDEIPFAMRLEVKDLGGTEIAVGNGEDMAGRRV